MSSSSYSSFSYSTSVCELFFEKMKRTDLNPDNIQTGKSKLSDIAKLVYKRALEVSHSHVMAMQEKIILNLFQYLYFHKL